MLRKKKKYWKWLWWPNSKKAQQEIQHCLLPEGEACDDEQEEGEKDQPATAVKLLLHREGVKHSHHGSLWITRATKLDLTALWADDATITTRQRTLA